MVVLLGVLFLAAAVAPLLFRFLGRSSFVLLSLAPFAGLAYSLTLIPQVFGDAPPQVEELGWMPQLLLSIVLRMDALSWIMSLLVTGVGLPLLGVAALGISRCDGLAALTRRVGKKYSLFFTCLL